MSSQRWQSYDKNNCWSDKAYHHKAATSAYWRKYCSISIHNIFINLLWLWMTPFAQFLCLLHIFSINTMMLSNCELTTSDLCNTDPFWYSFMSYLLTSWRVLHKKYIYDVRLIGFSSKCMNCFNKKGWFYWVVIAVTSQHSGNQGNNCGCTFCF